MNEVTLQHTAQQQIHKLLEELFDGKNVRFFPKERDTWFVAKDVVEAAGATWDAGNFRKLLGEGGLYLKQPLEINGISQVVIVCSTLGALKWIAKAEPPKGDALSAKLWEIVGRVTKGEQVNAPAKPSTAVVAPESKSNLASAAEELNSVMTPLLTLYKGMRVPREDIYKVYVQHAMTIGPKHAEGNNLVPEFMSQYLPTGKQASTLAHASTGGEIMDPTALGLRLGYSSAQVNCALVWLKFQTKVRLGNNYYYLKLPAADAIADEKMQAPRRIGGYAPTKIIKGWRENLVFPHLQGAFTKFPLGIFP